MSLRLTWATRWDPVSKQINKETHKVYHSNLLELLLSKRQKIMSLAKDVRNGNPGHCWNVN
jgi:hypothetical protein